MTSRRDFLRCIGLWSTSALIPQSVSQAAASEERLKADLLEINHEQNFRSGRYNLYAFAYGAKPLVLGTDYDAVWTVDPSQFPRKVKLDWYVPSGPLPNGGGVWGYHHIGYTVPQARQLKDLDAFVAAFDWSFSGTRNFNLLAECWLGKTSIPPEWNHKSALWEIGFFLHAADYDFHNGGTAIGLGHINSGVLYTCRRNDTFITFAPQSEADVLIGEIDWKAAFQYLIDNQVLTGREWLSGQVCLLGIEPTIRLSSESEKGMWNVNIIEARYS